MTALGEALLAELDERSLDRLAELLAPRLAARVAPTTEPGPWLNTRQAAEHLGCQVGRVHDLVQLHKLEPRRDGRRLLFKQSDLDAYIEGSG